MKKLKYLLSLLTFAVFILAAGGSDDSSSNPNSFSSSDVPGVGEMCTMTSDCFGAVSEDAFDEVTKCSTAKDEVGIQLLIAAGQAAVVHQGDRGKVLDLGILKTQVRFEDGTALYVPTDFVRK